MRSTETARATLLPHPPWHQQPALLRRLLQDPQPVLDELRDRYGPIFGLGSGPVRMAVVADPAALRDLFRTSTDSFRWGHPFNVLGFVVGEGSMIVSDGPDHKRRRSPVQGAFSRRRLNRWIPMIVDQVDAAVDRLSPVIASGPTTVDLYPVGRRVVLEVVVRALFGENMAERAGEIGELFERPQKYLESSALRQLPHPFPFTARSRVRADRRALDALIDVEIDRRRHHPSGDPLDVLETLVADGSLSDGEIRDQVVTLIGAGYDTTAASLSWALWCATLTPGLWDRLGQEADAVFGSAASGLPVEESALGRLDLADRTMRETLRLHPAGAISPRQTTVELEVGGHHVPKGTLILWSAHLAGRDPGAWSDPLIFDPDRFANPTPEQAALADLAWVPFGGGARNCIGFALAQMELTLIISRLAQRLEVVAPGGEKPRPVGMVVNRPSGGAPMTISARR